MKSYTQRERKIFSEIKILFDSENYLTFDDNNFAYYRNTVEKLKEDGYIKVIYADGATIIYKNPSFDLFDDELKDNKKAEQKLSAREWKIAIVGAMIGLIPFVVTTVIPWIISIL